MAVAQGSLCDHSCGDSDVGVFRSVSLGHRSGARSARPLDLPAVRCGMTDVATKNWYIVHTYSGFEKKVAESLAERKQAYGLGDEIGEILIPTEDVVEMRGGRKVVSSKIGRASCRERGGV